jgi:hypothetical protein
LLSAKKPLNDLYQEWLKSDYSIMDDLRNNITDTIISLEKCWYREKEYER